VEKQNDNRLLLDSSDEEDSFEKEMNDYLKFSGDDRDNSDDDFGSTINKKKILRTYREKHKSAKVNKNILVIGFLAVIFGISNMVGIFLQQIRIEYYLIQINSNTRLQQHFQGCLNYHRQAIISPEYRMYN
jgi:hypothetical protein